MSACPWSLHPSAFQPSDFSLRFPRPPIDGKYFPGMYIGWDFFQPSYTCPWELQRVGNLGDGGKWVCGMSRCMKARSRPMIVYSFGVESDSSFEAELLARTNAQVFAFDFSTDGFGPEIQAGDTRAHFEKIGVGEEASSEDGIRMQSLHDIMQRHGHSYVDIVKMDIEGDEFPVLTAFMDAYKEKQLPIGQLLVEIHLIGDNHTVQSFAEWWERLESFGMRPFSSEPNLLAVVLNGYPCCVEVSTLYYRLL